MIQLYQLYQAYLLQCMYMTQHPLQTKENRHLLLNVLCSNRCNCNVSQRKLWLKTPPAKTVVPKLCSAESKVLTVGFQVSTGTFPNNYFQLYRVFKQAMQSIISLNKRQLTHTTAKTYTLAKQNNVIQRNCKFLDINNKIHWTGTPTASMDTSVQQQLNNKK